MACGEQEESGDTNSSLVRSSSYQTEQTGGKGVLGKREAWLLPTALGVQTLTEPVPVDSDSESLVVAGCPVDKVNPRYLVTAHPTLFAHRLQGSQPPLFNLILSRLDFVLLS